MHTVTFAVSCLILRHEQRPDDFFARHFGEMAYVFDAEIPSMPLNLARQFGFADQEFPTID